MKRFLIIDDHPLYREALHAALNAISPSAAIHEATEVEAAIDMIAGVRQGYDLVLLDLMLPGTVGFDGLLMLHARFPRQPILVISALEDPRLIREALSYGVLGYITKSASKKDLQEAIQVALSGQIYVPKDVGSAASAADSGGLIARLSELTPQQMRVLQMIRQGKLNKQIAHELGLSETTVKAHVSEVLHKMNVSSRTQVVIETSRLDFDSILNSRT